MATSYEPSILAITESWLSDDISSRYTYDDYQSFTLSGNSAHSWGGVLFLCSPKFTMHEKTVLVKAPVSCDAIAVVDAAEGHCWVLVYRPPTYLACDTIQLCNYLDCILAQHKSVTIKGDFNLSQIRWNVYQPIASIWILCITSLCCSMPHRTCPK